MWPAAPSTHTVQQLLAVFKTQRIVRLNLELGCDGPDWLEATVFAGSGTIASRSVWRHIPCMQHLGSDRDPTIQSLFEGACPYFCKLL